MTRHLKIRQDRARLGQDDVLQDNLSAAGLSAMNGDMLEPKFTEGLATSCA